MQMQPVRLFCIQISQQILHSDEMPGEVKVLKYTDYTPKVWPEHIPH